MFSDPDSDKDENENQLNLQPEPGPSTSRKRSLNKDNWIANKRKLLLNSGKEYLTKTRKRIYEKRFENVDCCGPKK